MALFSISIYNPNTKVKRGCQLQHQANTTKCPYCGVVSTPYYDSRRGEFYCSNCGYVIETEMISSEYDLSIAKNDFEISKQDSKIPYNYLGGTYKVKVSETIKEGIRMIKKVCSQLNLPWIVTYWAEITYEKCCRHNMLKDGHVTIEAAVMAVIIRSIEKHEILMSPESIVQYSLENPDKIHSFYLKIIKLENIKP